jgi:HEAT repeat protein
MASCLKPNCIAALGAIGPDAKQAVPLLLELLKSDNSTMVHYASRSLGLIRAEPESVVPALVELANDDYFCLGAAFGLGGFPESPEAIAALGRLVETDGAAGEEAVRSLARMGEAAKSMQPRLIAKVNTEAMPAARAEIVFAVVAVDPKGANTLSFLREQLKNEYASVRVASLDALGEMGPAAAAAVPDLLELLKQPQLIDSVGLIQANRELMEDLRKDPEMNAQLLAPISPEVIKECEQLIQDTLNKIDPEWESLIEKTGAVKARSSLAK